MHLTSLALAGGLETPKFDTNLSVLEALICLPLQ